MGLRSMSAWPMETVRSTSIKSGTPSTRFSGSWTCTVPQCDPRPREAIASCMWVQVFARPSVKWLACRPKVNAAFTVAHHDDHDRRLVPGTALLPAGAVADFLPFVLEIVAFDLEGGMAKLERPHLLHPEAELLVGVLEGVVERLLLLRILDDEVLPRLAVRARHRPAARLEDLLEVLVGDWIGLDAAHAHARRHDPVENVVVGFGLGAVGHG